MTHVPNNPAAARFAFDNTYARELEGFYVTWKAAQVAQPRLVKLNRELAEELGLDAGALDSDEGARIFAGNETPAGAAPLAQAYAGHQFGGFSPQLGDGRALLLGEVIDRNGRRRDIQLKGSGPTPFSRAGDGRAALGPVLREYLIGEAMHALGIPTTRALAAVITGEPVYREACAAGRGFDAGCRQPHPCRHFSIFRRPRRARQGAPPGRLRDRAPLPGVAGPRDSLSGIA